MLWYIMISVDFLKGDDENARRKYRVSTIFKKIKYSFVITLTNG